MAQIGTPRLVVLVRNPGASLWRVRANNILEVVYRLELSTERTAVRTTRFMMVPDPGMPILSKARVNGGLDDVIGKRRIPRHYACYEDHRDYVEQQDPVDHRIGGPCNTLLGLVRLRGG